MNTNRIKINTNLSPKHYFALIILFAVIFIGISIYNACYIIEKQDYIKITATITDLSDNYSIRTENKVTSIEYEYLYNNQVYTNIQRTFSNNNKNIGQQINIYINPNNPKDVVDLFFIRGCLLFNFFTLVFLIICIKCYKIRKATQYIKYDDDTDKKLNTPF